MKNAFFYLAAFLVFGACHPRYYSPNTVEHHNYQVDGGFADTAGIDFLRPYRDSMSATMNRVIGRTSIPFVKAMPASSLGYFITDGFLWGAQRSFNQHVDLAFINNGGIRLNDWGGGDVTLARVYETLPFDNIMVLVKLKGSVLQEFMNHISSRGGWPVSGGTYRVQNGEASNILIGGAPLDPQKEYTIALSDYVVNGGDDARMLQGLPVVSNGYLQRDAIIDYIRYLMQEKGTIAVPEMNRVEVLK